MALKLRTTTDRNGPGNGKVDLLDRVKLGIRRMADLVRFQDMLRNNGNLPSAASACSPAAVAGC
jgi:hypothetical protein